MNSRLDARLGKFQTLSLWAGVAALALCTAGFFPDRRQFFFSYLAGWLFWLGLSAGSLLIVMIHHLTGGRWGYPARRLWEAAFMVLPVMLLLFIPICFGLGELYPWARPADVLAEKVLRHRQGFQSGWAFAVRAAVILGILAGLAVSLRKCSLRQDATPDAAPTRRARVISGPGLIIAGLALTFASVDWVMSLEKRWFSSIFGIVFMGGQVLGAFAFAIVMLAMLRTEEPYRDTLNKTQVHPLGNLLLTAVMFWAYVSFGQLLIIYSGDLPPELDWYLHRIAGGWKYVVIALGIFHFLAPFFLLLFRVMKLHPGPLAAIAAMVLAAHAMDAYWMVMPSFHQTRLNPRWLDLAAPIGIGGLWISFFLARLRSAALLPPHDPGRRFNF